MSFVVQKINKWGEGLTPFQVSRNTLGAIIFAYYAVKASKHVAANGLKKSLLGLLLQFAKNVPGAKEKIAEENAKVVQKLEKMVIGNEGKHEEKHVALPKQSVPQEQLLALTHKWKQIEDAKWNKGQVSGGIYHGSEAFLQFLVTVYGFFALSNPLHPEVFPYVRKMESEVIAMTISLFNGNPECCGAMTSGGTESILMACKAYRDRAYSRGIKTPEIIAATTVHAAFDKAAHYFGMKLVHVPVDPDTFKIDIAQLKARINRNTVLLVGSAPCFPQGVVDDIQQLSDIAVERQLGLHVDCCLGGFLMPFLSKLGYDAPLFDFRLPGVSSISADTHKYGYAPKGSSVVMFSSKELRSYMYFVAAEWSGGIYASPTMPGSRPGGLIAATWAAMLAMGEEGYLECARGIMKAAKAIEAGVRSIDGLRVLGQPDMSVIAFAADPLSERGRKLNIYKVSEAMGKRDWNLNTLQKPSSVHICCTYMHRDCADKFVKDLEDSVQEVIENPDGFKNGSAAIYGMAESIPDASLVSDLAKSFLDCLSKVA